MNRNGSHTHAYRTPQVLEGKGLLSSFDREKRESAQAGMCEIEAGRQGIGNCTNAIAKNWLEIFYFSIQILQPLVRSTQQRPWR